ncbi:MAG: bifunctional riboflavin kinase/FAD synthetase [Deltaproteobacteria bacterium]|nr:bifunctional riboflavin kinase/FAD synthetase [Deltaproteobacteria bacterium]
MQCLRNSSKWKSAKKPLALALGNFDGVHLGHQTILKKLLAACKKNRWTSGVYTFDPHPAKILSPKTAPSLLQTVEQKLESLEEQGVEKVILEKFDPAFAHLTPRKFFDTIIVKRLKAKSLWVGYDFTFGVRRSGNVALLKQFCKEAGIEMHIATAHFEKETLVSSTQIRLLVSKGKVWLAKELLGKPFALIGTVEKGMGIGREMGIHTANLHVENELLPKKGIYITRTNIRSADVGPRPSGGRRRTSKNWPSATSVGWNPTFPGKGFSIETHLIGFKGNLVGKKIEVEFLEYLRDELTFPNSETLADQIKKDINIARRFNETFRDHR